MEMQKTGFIDTNVNKAKIDIKKLVLQCWNEKINFQYSLPTHRYKTNLKSESVVASMR